MSQFSMVALGKICERITVGHVGKTSPYYRNSGIPFLRTQNVGEGNLLLSELKYVTNEFHKKLTKSSIQAGDVLISRVISDRINCGIVPEHLGEANCANVILVRPGQSVHPNYLVHFIASPIAQRQLLKKQVGSAQSVVNTKVISSWHIPLPPLDEQRRIAAILDKADAVRRKRREAIRLTEELLRSLFLEMFGDPVINPKGWDKGELKTFGNVLTGNTPPRSDPENYGGEIEWIKSDNITTPEHFLTKAEEELSKKGKKIARTVPSGSILVTCIAGSRSSIGRAAIANREVAFNQQINALIPNENVDPYFLYGHFFIAQHLVQAKSTDSMKGLVNKSKFSSVEFLKPPPQKQREFGQWFSNFYKYYENLIRVEQQSNSLFSSLLQRAFRGDL